MRFHKLIKAREVENTWNKESAVALFTALDQSVLGPWALTEYDYEESNLRQGMRRKLAAAQQLQPAW